MVRFFPSSNPSPGIAEGPWKKQWRRFSQWTWQRLVNHLPELSPCARYCSPVTQVTEGKLGQGVSFNAPSNCFTGVLFPRSIGGAAVPSQQHGCLEEVVVIVVVETRDSGVEGAVNHKNNVIRTG